MSSTKIRWGFLGTGNIARQFAAGVRGSHRGVLQAVGSRALEGAEEFAQSQGALRAHGSYAALLADAEVDAVYNALPNSMHHEWTIRALEAGKHVLCEKPFAATLAEAKEMFAAARRAKRVLVEAFMYRSHPQTLAVQKAVASGAIGELRLIRSSFCYRTTRIDDNIRFSAGLAGGALMDIGCYCLNLARLFTGSDPISLSAAGRVHASGVDEAAAGVLLFPGGVLASFTCGMTAAADNTAYLCGTEGYIEIAVPWKPQPGKAGFTIRRGTPPKMELGGKRPVAPAPEYVAVAADGDLYGYEADDFAAAVLDGAAPRVSEADTLAVQSQLDVLRQKVGVKGV
jgi:predicted dehydrogenase